MKPSPPSSRYGFQAALLLLAALALASQPLASALDVAEVNVIGALLGAPAHESPVFLATAGGALLLWALVLYVRQFDRFVAGRRRAAIWMNWMAPAVFAASASAASELGASRGEPGAITLVVAPATVIGVPWGVLLLEKLCFALLNRAGLWAQANQWRMAAARLSSWSLLFRPGDEATIRAIGLLLVEADEFARAVEYLERLGPADQSDDPAVVRALERAYRWLGRAEDALTALRRLAVLQPETPGIDRRLLDDYLKLGRHQDALDLIESGRFKEDADLLVLRQELNVKLGNIAQALEQIRRIAEQETPPYTRSIKLYRDLLEQVPDHIEIRINLGRLLLQDAAEARRQEGARLLELAYSQDPRRLYLGRLLAQYYRECGQPEKMYAHYRMLVERGDADPESYLHYAQHLREEGQLEKAIVVLERLSAVAPDEWRGFHRLARLRLESGALDEALRDCRRARERAPAGEIPMLEKLEREIVRRRRERELAARASVLDDPAADPADKLEIIAEMIRMEWIDRAILHCEKLLDAAPTWLPQVERMLEAALHESGGHYRLCDFLCDLYLNEGRFEDALKFYRAMASRALDAHRTLAEGCRKILTRAPHCLQARRELARVQRELGRWDEVLQTLQPLMIDGSQPVEPADEALWVEALCRLGRAEEAYAPALRLVDRLAADADFMAMTVDLLAELGRYDEACDVLLRAKQALPGDERIAALERRVIGDRKRHRFGVLTRREAEGRLSPEEHYELAELFRERGDLQKAIVHYQHAAAGEARPGRAAARLAATLCERGMIDLADETLEPVELTRELAQEHPEVKRCMYDVALTLERSRRMSAALKYYKRIFRVDAAYADVVERIERLS